jgi:hypothetical protein
MKYEETAAIPMAPSGGSSGIEQPLQTPMRRTFLLTPLPRRRTSPDAAAPRADPMTTPFDVNVTSRGERTQHARQATPVPESTEAQDQLAPLQLRAAMAEATARIVAADQAAALGRRTTVEHLLATRELEDHLSRHSRSRSRTPPSPPVGQPTADLARLVQYFDEREARREHAAAERDARREMQHAAQLAALRGSPPAGGYPRSFVPNKGFSEITPFSGGTRSGPPPLASTVPLPGQLFEDPSR